jgi:hypothetical protein
MTATMNTLGELAAPGDRPGWEGVLTIEGQRTGDGRMLLPGSITWESVPFPMPLMWLPKRTSSHQESYVVGTITEVVRDGEMIRARGDWDTSESNEHAGEARRMAIEGVLRGLSVDLDDVESSQMSDGYNRVTGMVKAPEVNVHSARLRGVTIVPFPAIADAAITQAWSTETLTVRSSGRAMSEFPPSRMFSALGDETDFPVRWDPQTGEVMGLVVAWHSTHMSAPGKNVRPRRSPSGFKKFANRSCPTSDAGMVPTGVMFTRTVHPDLALKASDAEAHYHYSGCGVADVAAGANRWGIWVHGSMRPGLSPGQQREAFGSDWSPDWRPFEDLQWQSDVVAVLAVNGSGYVLGADGAAAETARRGWSVTASLDGGIMEGVVSDRFEPFDTAVEHGWAGVGHGSFAEYRNLLGDQASPELLAWAMRRATIESELLEQVGSLLDWAAPLRAAQLLDRMQ